MGICHSKKDSGLSPGVLATQRKLQQAKILYDQRYRTGIRPIPMSPVEQQLATENFIKQLIGEEEATISN